MPVYFEGCTLVVTPCNLVSGYQRLEEHVNQHGDKAVRSKQFAFGRSTVALDSSDHRSSIDCGSRSVNRTVRGGRGNVVAEVTITKFYSNNSL